MVTPNLITPEEFSSFLAQTIDFSKMLKSRLEDVFFLSTLAFTKPDDCSRLPLTIKILDMFLRDQASEYDKDKLDNIEYGISEEFEIIKPEINLN